MNALNYLNQIANYKSAFVPADLAKTIAGAAVLLGMRVNVGSFDDSTNTIVLHLA